MQLEFNSHLTEQELDRFMKLISIRPFNETDKPTIAERIEITSISESPGFSAKERDKKTKLRVMKPEL
jgi:hypothetical protein